jgi:hypothetical protein
MTNLSVSSLKIVKKTIQTTNPVIALAWERKLQAYRQRYQTVLGTNLIVSSLKITNENKSDCQLIGHNIFSAHLYTEAYSTTSVQ